MGICYVIQGAQPSAPWQLRGLGWSGRWEGVQERGDTHIYIYIPVADSCWCTAEANTILQSNCPLIKKKKKGKKMIHLRKYGPGSQGLMWLTGPWPGASHREYPKACVKGDPAGEARCQPFSRRLTVGKLSLQLGSPLSIRIQRSTLYCTSGEDASGDHWGTTGIPVTAHGSFFLETPLPKWSEACISAAQHASPWGWWLWVKTSQGCRTT